MTSQWNLFIVCPPGGSYSRFFLSRFSRFL
nr:MAG TPA: hypothetical protein [Caudoviricetes sp.]